ncbi:MAG: phosphoribosylanthranilate isomerase [Burkholderiaceae bacterium]|jgi:phosphoribosylanthranilate isomerase|nr:phosphoribosylanthranilate isomerase [Burkholderiaceae bacterium]
MRRTRIKICGLTRREDVVSAVRAGADALGFVFYAGSARHVTPAQAAALIQDVPPFVATVGLFVNAGHEMVVEAVQKSRLSLLQFHGDESPADCARLASAVNLPFIRALRVRPDFRERDLIQYEEQYRAAGLSALLLDTFAESYGGSGKVFDWSVLSAGMAQRVVLSGGLTAQNVGTAITRLSPYAVDVSSGVEREKGIKDPEKIRDFVCAVKRADQALRA